MGWFTKPKQRPQWQRDLIEKVAKIMVNDKIYCSCDEWTNWPVGKKPEGSFGFRLRLKDWGAFLDAHGLPEIKLTADEAERFATIATKRAISESLS